ncbi:hypothetical protein GGI1_06777 [Acidithiobacillus sp. GGI-221]|nr:hypothetical protein GGI1_06777 [Acidithiobacillus sp. GGI-221]
MWAEADVFMTVASFGVWIPAMMFWQWTKRAKKTVLLAEKRQAGRQEQSTASAETVESATPKGPGLLHRSTILLFRGVKWTTPRLFAGIRKVGRFTFMVSKAGAKASGAKYQAYRANKVATAKAAAAPAVSVNHQVDWGQYDQPAYQRVRNASVDQHHQIH